MVFKYGMQHLVSQVSANVKKLDEFILTEAIATVERVSSQLFTGDLKQR
jgi:hypothetical protein